jgi:hypothetical protein
LTAAAGGVFGLISVGAIAFLPFLFGCVVAAPLGLALAIVAATTGG